MEPVLNEDEIEIDSISDMGMIFISRIDPLSTFFSTLSGKKYSQAGFYYSTSDKQISVLLTDLGGLKFPCWSFPISLITLTNNPLIDKIIIRKLRKEM